MFINTQNFVYSLSHIPLQVMLLANVMLKKINGNATLDIAKMPYSLPQFLTMA